LGKPLQKRTVFFGPFIGELGWELAYWQGWVRKVCKGQFKDYRKIAASVPGREPFYPYVDEFRPLPESFLKLGISGHAYYADGWRGGYPGKQVDVYTLREVLGRLRRVQWPQPVSVEQPLRTPDVEPQAESMLAHFKEQLPEDTLYFVPWKMNHYEPDRLDFGTSILPGVLPRSDEGQASKPIDFEFQQPEYLEPTPEGEKAFRKIMADERKLIAIFPRCRIVRRADKNWPREKYLGVIQALQAARPDFVVAIFGEPGGAYFADGVPDGCLDLINPQPARRMDLQLAALKRCVMALGGLSGSLLVALAAGCPALVWGYLGEQARFYCENFMGTPMIYYSSVNPSVDTVVGLSQSLLLMLRNWSKRLG
jgi:hypothetical protein